MHVSGFQVQAQRQAIAIDDYVPFAGFPRSRRPNFVAPFFAFT
jgi:hypothetical protein